MGMVDASEFDAAAIAWGCGSARFGGKVIVFSDVRFVSPARKEALDAPWCFYEEPDGLERDLENLASRERYAADNIEEAWRRYVVDHGWYGLQAEPPWRTDERTVAVQIAVR